MPDRTIRPPYLLALVVSGIVLGGYVVSLAPTVTFWDAGEFIAAAKILGIPHPPGTPLFVLVGHVWGTIFPFGEYAFRLNLLSALFSSLTAGLFFLLAHETLRRFTADMEVASARLLRVFGALAATLVAAFSFTQWQNSNETEVYAVAVFTIAAISWLCHVWREHRKAGHGANVLLLIVYLAGLSVGNHLLALLVGPAVVAFVASTLSSEPAADRGVRRSEWAQLAVVAGVWALLIGVGLGNTTLAVLGGVCFLAAALFAASAGSLGYAVLALIVAVVGVTSYLYLYIRSAHHPIINEAAPDNLESLIAVIRRAQYDVRTPFDDPTVRHGPDNPGRSLPILAIQLLGYIFYFDWQWANGLKLAAGNFQLRTVFTLVFLMLGLHGLFMQRRTDRSGWWLLFTLFLVTGLGLVFYMNFKPGFSLAYDRWPEPTQHEVRERDYFFIASFVVWGVWAGLGLASLARDALERWGARGRPIAVAVLAIAVLPFILNFSAASRRHGRDTYLAADFAYDLLNSVGPYGVLFTYGDNDTFPLWWAQEVADIRKDVTIICLSLANTDWYMRQLRDNPIRTFDEASAPAIWQGRHSMKPDWPTHSMTDQQIAASFPGTVLNSPTPVHFGPITHTYPAEWVFYPNDFLTLRVVQQNIGRRPIAWAQTTGGNFQGLNEYVLQQGLAYVLQTARPDTSDPNFSPSQFQGTVLNIATTERLAWETYRYRRMLEGELAELDPTSQGMAGHLGSVFTQLAVAYEKLGNLAKVRDNLERAVRFSPSPALFAALEQLRLRTRESGVGSRE